MIHYAMLLEISSRKYTFKPVLCLGDRWSTTCTNMSFVQNVSLPHQGIFNYLDIF